MNVQFTYIDFNGLRKSANAEVVQQGEWFHAQNLAEFGCGKRVSSVLHWHPVRAALKELIGGRQIVSWINVE